MSEENWVRSDEWWKKKKIAWWTLTSIPNSRARLVPIASISKDWKPWGSSWDKEAMTKSCELRTTTSILDLFSLGKIAPSKLILKLSVGRAFQETWVLGGWRCWGGCIAMNSSNWSLESWANWSTLHHGWTKRTWFFDSKSTRRLLQITPDFCFVSKPMKEAPWNPIKKRYWKFAFI